VERCTTRANDATLRGTLAIFGAMRPAFTIIELLVAITVLTVGVLALAATAGLMASQVGEGGRLTGSAHFARSILDSLGSLDCGALTSGSATGTGGNARWTITQDSIAAHIDLDVRSALRRRSRRDDYQVLVPCGGE
jgi:hypothetical protein